eukprot:56622-Chlamydomonas_euryale.AAC.1
MLTVGRSSAGPSACAACGDTTNCPGTRMPLRWLPKPVAPPAGARGLQPAGLGGTSPRSTLAFTLSSD